MVADSQGGRREKRIGGTVGGEKKGEKREKEGRKGGNMGGEGRKGREDKPGSVVVRLSTP